MTGDLKNVDSGLFDTSITEARFGVPAVPHPPRILMLYGSVRERSYSRLATEEAARLLTAMGAEVRIFNPSGLPLPDDAPDSHPKVMELRELVRWSEGMVWCSPERHGAMTGIMKAQIDWIPLSEGAVRPSQGKTLAVMQVCGGSQSFNAVNQMRILGRWMRMITIPNQSSVAKAWMGMIDIHPHYDEISVYALLIKSIIRSPSVSSCANRLKMLPSFCVPTLIGSLQSLWKILFPFFVTTTPDISPCCSLS